MITGALASVGSTNFQRAARLGSAGGWRAAASTRPDRPGRLALLEHLGEDLPVGEAQHVVEVALRVLGIAAGVGPAQHGDRAPLPEEVAQRIGELGRLGEGTDEEEIEIGRDLLKQVLRAGVADELHLVARLLAPDANIWGMMLARFAFMIRP